MKTDDTTPRSAPRGRLGRMVSRVVSDGSLTKKASLNAAASTAEQGARIVAGLIVSPILLTRARGYGLRHLAGPAAPHRPRITGERSSRRGPEVDDRPRATFDRLRLQETAGRQRPRGVAALPSAAPRDRRRPGLAVARVARCAAGTPTGPSAWRRASWSSTRSSSACSTFRSPSSRERTSGTSGWGCRSSSSSSANRSSWSPSTSERGSADWRSRRRSRPSCGA